MGLRCLAGCHTAAVSGLRLRGSLIKAISAAGLTDSSSWTAVAAFRAACAQLDRSRIIGHIVPAKFLWVLIQSNQTD